MNRFPEWDSEDDEIDVEHIEHAPPATERSRARHIALQVLYELDSTKHPIGQVIDTHVQARSNLPSKVVRYMRNLVLGVHQHQAELDALIQQYAPERPLADLAIIDRNILRLALCEMFLRPHIPCSIIVHEAVNLADIFGAENSTRFVNGVLGTVTEDIAQLRQRFQHLASSEETNADEVDL